MSKSQKPENNGKLIVIVLGLVLLLILLVGLSVILNNATTKTYTSEDPELKFDYPKDWYVEQDLEEFFISEKDFNEEKVAHFMELYAYDIEDFDPNELEAITSQSCEDLASILGYDAFEEDYEMELVDTTTFETKNTKGCGFEMADTDSMNGYQFNYYTHKGSFVYNMIITGDDRKDMVKIDLFKAITKSLEALD